ncbi:MAG TPA: YceD family protein [Dokdonella sp.]|uniref:YceD family protein n=1 Tax=Dokdonella sp. TaxID=2291710 RepID=UPI002D80DDB1|nr:YceD family protein [Dokdonella sp.]HET9031294.1 YceD family protein [Dokdonella sp.]
MSNTLPDSLDPWRTVQARRVFEGTLAVAQMRRLVGLLASADGEVSYYIEFDRDAFEISYIDLKLDTSLKLICQRSMAEYSQPIRVDQRLGLIRDDSEEARLPEGYDPLLVEDGQLCVKDVIEDELILALPLVALSPGAPLEQVPVTSGPDPEDEQPPNPFAVLGQLKNSKH